MTPSLPRFAGVAAATLAAVCAVGCVPTWNLAGASGVSSMGLAALLIFACALVGYVPIARHLLGTSVEGRAQNFMVGMSVRMFLTLGVLLTAWNGGWLPHRGAFLLWIGVLYAVVLVLETVLLSRGLRTGPDGSASA